jgi:Protein of unknown function (DUF3011)
MFSLRRITTVVMILTLAILCPLATAQQGTMNCASNDGRYKYCRVDTQNYVRLVRQNSGSPCTYGRTWGYDYRGIWVDRGCRATFDYGRGGGGGGGSNTGAAVAAGILGAIIVGSAIAAANNDKSDHHDDTAEQRRQYYRDGYRHGQRDWDNDRSSDYRFYNDRYPGAFERDFADGYNDGYNDRPSRY